MHTFQINALIKFFNFDVFYVFQTSRVHPKIDNADFYSMFTCIYVRRLLT